MIQPRKAGARGRFRNEWLTSFYTFAFANYYEPEFDCFYDLKVLNEDRILPGKGFETHSHRDMEIITYVHGGSLEHKDSMGNTSILKAGKLQRMTAGTGVTHSEKNASQTEELHLFQIWLQPNKRDLEPSYQEIDLPPLTDTALKVIASSDRTSKTSLHLYQDAKIYNGFIGDTGILKFSVLPERKAWIHTFSGILNINGYQFTAGDGAGIEGEPELQFRGTPSTHFLLFDLS